MNTDVIERIKQAFCGDDADQVRQLLNQHPELKSRINEPVGPFDSPVICNVRSKAMLNVLLDAGADINARSQWWAGGFGLLDSADPELSAYVIQRGATVTAHAAARLGMLEKLTELVTADPALVHARGGDGKMPLHFAGTVEIAAYLLDHGADIDAKDIDHESTPAQYLIDEHPEIARYLVSRGCKTDILLAAALGDINLVRRHLDDDPACIRMSVSDEYFPMIGGQAGGTIYQWKLGWHVSAHQVARKFGHNDVLQLLLERSPPAVKLLDACWMNDAATVDNLRAQHPQIADELSDADRRHVAHAAPGNNETAVVGLMLEAGFPADATSQHGGTPLHWAAFQGNLEMATIILPYKPPLEVMDRDFESTPLGWAIYGSENGWHCGTSDYPGTVTALLEAGANPPEEISGTPAVLEVLRNWRS